MFPQTFCHTLHLESISLIGPQEGHTFMVMEGREGSKLAGGMNLSGGFEN